MEHSINHWVNILIPGVGAVPEDSVGHLGQDGVGREEASDLRFDLRDLVLQQLEILVEQVLDLVGRSFLQDGFFVLQHAFANVDELSVGSRPHPETAPLSAWRAATGLRAERHEAGDQCGIDPVCLGQSSPDFPERLDLRERVAALGSRPPPSWQKRHSWPPVASKQTKAFLTLAISSSSEISLSVFGRRS